MAWYSASLAGSRLDIVAFFGHVHTRELFQADGVKYFVLGGGGAEQDPILPGRTHLPNLPADYPTDIMRRSLDTR